MSLLSSKQKIDLNNSILNYLKPLISNQETLTNLQKDLQIEEIKDDNDLLVKKWNAIIRLQKKILDLESQLEQLSKIQSLSSNISISANTDLVKFNWLPSKLKKTLNHDSNITSIAIHPTLPQLVTASIDGSFTVWNLLDLVQPLNRIQAHTKSVNSIIISPEKLDFNNDNHVIITVSSDLYIKIWDFATLKLIRTLTGHEHVVSSVVFKNDNLIYTSSRDNSIRLWDLKLGWCLKSFIGHSDWVRTLDVSENKEYLLSGSNDQSIRLSHGESGTGLGLLIGHEQVVETVKFAPTISNRYIDQLHNTEITSPETYEKTGYKYAISGGRDDIIRIWILPLVIFRPHNHPLPSSNPQGTLVKTLIGHRSWVKDLAFHPNGKILISCSDDKSIKFWDLENGNCIRTLNGHEGFINSIEWAPSIYEVKEEELIDDEQLINDNMRCVFVSGGSDASVKLWD